MTKDKDIKTVVPALRFPEFRDTEGWEDKQRQSQRASAKLRKVGEEYILRGIKI